MLTKGFCSDTRDRKYPCVCRRTKLPGRGVHGEVRSLQETNHRKSCDR